MEKMEKKIDNMMEKPVVEQPVATDDKNKKSGGFDHLLGEDSDDEYESREKNEKLTNCCCCLCVCDNDVTAGITCCCCCPIKCGIMVIGCMTILLTFYYISWNFFLILND